MKKKVLGLVMAALAISSIGAFAQNDAQQNRAQTQKECCKEGKGKKGKKECKGDKSRKGAQSNKAFEGIQLTADQQQKIEELKANRKANIEKLKATQKNAYEQERKNFDNELAKVLTPEQYKQYESNKAAISARKQEKMKKKLAKMGR